MTRGPVTSDFKQRSTIGVEPYHIVVFVIKYAAVALMIELSLHAGYLGNEIVDAI